MGAWRRNPAKWYEQTMVYCELCGRVIPKNFWVVEEDSRDLIFCDPDCEALYRDYWVQTRRQA